MASSSYQLGKSRLKKINQIIDKYYEGLPLKDLAKLVGWTEKTLQNNLAVYHKHFGTASRKSNIRMTIEQDAELICERLVTNSVRSVAHEYGVSAKTLRDSLKAAGKWKETPKGKLNFRVSLDDLKKGAWADLHEETVLTIGRVDKFILVPLDAVR